MAEIKITKSAEKYLDDLLDNQSEDTIGIKIFVTEPGSPRAETCIAYAKQEDDLSGYTVKTGFKFPLYLEEISLKFI